MILEQQMDVVCMYVSFVTDLFLVVLVQLRFQEGGQVCLCGVLFQLEQYQGRAARC